ncbi:MAG: hypothetical protein GX621_04310 [Pirellulaceae bacterium]|nr:hypothetical protein [Pirellulaceae bacterium]
MADETRALISYLNSRPVAPVFSPCAYYGEDEDAVIFYFRNAPDYAKRINKWITLYLSMDTDELVGCRVKGVGRVLQDMDAFGVDVKHNKVELRAVFLAFLGVASEDSDTRELYKQLGRAATEAECEIALP